MDKIIAYFTEEKNTTVKVAEILSKKLTKYNDIKSEFIYWLEHRNLDMPNAIEIEGYKATDIQKIEPSLDIAGVYNFMVTLRDDPQKAHEYIQNGFPRK